MRDFCSCHPRNAEFVDGESWEGNLGFLKPWTGAGACAGLWEAMKNSQENLAHPHGVLPHPGDPTAGLDNPFHEEIFPHIQSKSPLKQFEAVSLCHLRDETEPSLAPQWLRF